MYKQPPPSVRARAEGGDVLAKPLPDAFAGDALLGDCPLCVDHGLVGEADVRLHDERVEGRLDRTRDPWLNLHRREGRRAACGRRARRRHCDGGGGRRRRELELEVHVVYGLLSRKLALVPLRVHDVDHEAIRPEVPAHARHGSSTTGRGS